MANSQLNDQDKLRILWAQLLESCAQILSRSPIEEGPETARLLSELPPIAMNFSSQALQVPLGSVFSSGGHDGFNDILSQLTAYLPWEAKFNEAGQRLKYAWVDLIGPDSVQHSDHFRMGLFWQNRNVTYPRHHHNAVELYYVLSGVADWQQGNSDWFSRPAGSYFLHQSQEVHATHTNAEPLLTLWAWHGDLGWDSYQIEG